MEIDERTQLFINVHTMRVICSVKVKRKDERVSGGGAFFKFDCLVFLGTVLGSGPSHGSYPEAVEFHFDLPIYCNFFRNGIPP